MVSNKKEMSPKESETHINCESKDFTTAPLLKVTNKMEADVEWKFYSIAFHRSSPEDHLFIMDPTKSRSSLA